MNSRVKDDLVQSLKSFLPFEVVNPNPSNRYDKLLTYIKESDVPDNVNLFYPDKLALVGNLGIGTRNPVRGLHLEGDSGTSAIRFKTTGGEWDFAPFWSAFDDGNFSLNRVSGSGNLLIPSGNVGIGVNDPSQKLDVVGRIRSSYNSDDYFEIGSSDAGGFALGFSGGVEKINFRTYGDSYFNGGNLGIGTDSPAVKLVIDSGSTASGVRIQSSSWADFLSFLNTSTGGRQWTLANAGASNVHSVNAGTFYIRDSTAGANRLAIDSSGNVGIGTTAVAVGYKLTNDGPFFVNAGGGTGITINGAAGGNRILRFHTGDISSNSIRWGLAANATAEGGSNAGSDFGIYSYDDAGSYISEALTIKRSTGNVGIGEPSPATTLHVKSPSGIGKIRLEDDAGRAVELQSPSSGADNGRIGTITNHDFEINAGNGNGTNVITFLTDGSEKVRIANDGSVGIGTNNPGSTLDVQGGNVRIDGGSVTDRQLYFRNQSQGTVGGSVRSDQTLSLFAGVGGSPTQAVTIERETLNVGIGTDSPSRTVDIVQAGDASMRLSSSGANNVAYTFYEDNTNAILEIAKYGTSRTDVKYGKTLGGYALLSDNNGTSNGFVIGTASSSGPLIFGTNNAERALIDSSGNVGIGETSPATILHISQGGEPPAEGMLILQANTSARQLRIQPPTTADNGFFDSRGGNMTFLDDGTEIWRYNASTITTTQGINVGIGVSPQARLHVAGDNDTEVIRVGGAGDPGGVQGSAYIGISPWKPTSVQTYSPIRIGAKEIGIADYRSDLIFETRDVNSDSAPVERMRITYNGFVKTTNLAFVGASIENYTTANDSGNLWVNYEGYNGGSTYFRDFKIGNGKQSVIAFFDGSSGNVGIGEDVPASLLTLKGGNILLEYNSTGADDGHGIFFHTTTNGWGEAASHAAIYGKRVDASNGYLRFDTRSGGTTDERMRLDENGNLGIGTDSPLLKLHVQGDVTGGLYNQVSGQFVISGETNTNKRLNIGFDTSTDKAFLQSGINGTGYNDLLLNPNGGKVGIGETNPDAHHVAIREARKGNVIGYGAIQVSSTATTIDDRVGIVFNHTSFINRGRAAIMATAENATGGSASLSFFTRNALDGTELQTTDERMRITSAGDVSIGGDATPSARLNVTDEYDGDGDIAYFENTHSNGGAFLTIKQYETNAQPAKAAGIRLGTKGNINWYQGILRRGGSDHFNTWSLNTSNDNNTVEAKFAVTTGGDVGIGVTRPLQKLDVRGYASILQGPGWGIGNTWTSTPNSAIFVGIGDDSTFNSGVAAIHVENRGNRGNIANSIGSDLLRLEYNDRDGILYNRYGALQIGNFTARPVTTGDDVMMMQLEGIPRWDGSDWSEWPGIQIIANNANSGGAALYLAHARGSAIASNTALLNSDSLGVVAFSGANGTDIQTGANIYAQADGNWSGTNQGADIVFETTANGSTAFPSERARILSSGGITFNGDTSSNNALSDYEEGSFTPTIIATTTNPTVGYSVQYGRYTKVGNIVTVQLKIDLSSFSGGSGGINIGGLPFTSNSDGNYRSAGNVCFSRNVTNGGAAIMLNLGPNVNRASLIKYTNADNYDTNVAPSDLAFNSVIHATMTYEAQ